MQRKQQTVIFSRQVKLQAVFIHITVLCLFDGSVFSREYHLQILKFGSLSSKTHGRRNSTSHFICKVFCVFRNLDSDLTIFGLNATSQANLCILDSDITIFGFKKFHFLQNTSVVSFCQKLSAFLDSGYNHRFDF